MGCSCNHDFFQVTAHMFVCHHLLLSLPVFASCHPCQVMEHMSLRRCSLHPLSLSVLIVPLPLSTPSLLAGDGADVRPRESAAGGPRRREEEAAAHPDVQGGREEGLGERGRGGRKCEEKTLGSMTRIITCLTSDISLPVPSKCGRHEVCGWGSAGKPHLMGGFQSTPYLTPYLTPCISPPFPTPLASDSTTQVRHLCWWLNGWIEECVPLTSDYPHDGQHMQRGGFKRTASVSVTDLVRSALSSSASFICPGGALHSECRRD